MSTNLQGFEFRQKIETILSKPELTYDDFRAVENNLKALEYVLVYKNTRKETKLREPIPPIQAGKCSTDGCEGTSKEMYLVGEGDAVRWICGSHIHDMAIGNPKLSAACFRIGRDGKTGAKMGEGN